jgi:hypothetical protein
MSSDRVLKWSRLIFEELSGPNSGSSETAVHSNESKSWDLCFVHPKDSSESQGVFCICNNTEAKELTVNFGGNYLVEEGLRNLIDLIKQLEDESWTEKEIGNIPRIVATVRDSGGYESRL